MIFNFNRFPEIKIAIYATSVVRAYGDPKAKAARLAEIPGNANLFSA